jgi:hypothetical protein
MTHMTPQGMQQTLAVQQRCSASMRSKVLRQATAQDSTAAAERFGGLGAATTDGMHTGVAEAAAPDEVANSSSKAAAEATAASAA